MYSVTILCPRCGIPMDYVMEAEAVNHERRLTRYYQCPACRTKVLDERIMVRHNGAYVLISVQDYSTDGSRPIISVSRPRKAAKPARPAAKAEAR